MSINYSVERLAQDKLERSHIINELVYLKEKYQIHNQKLIELGCGTGGNLEIFANDNTVLGVEGLEDAVSFMNDKLNIEARQANLEQPLSFIEDNIYEWAICLDVLEHLIDPFFLMTEIRRILVPGGRAIINVPNHLEITGRIRILLGSDLDVHNYFPEYEEWNNPHIRFFTHQGITKMFHKSGFEVLDDLGIHFSTQPMQSKLNRLGLNWLNKKIFNSNPALFSGALFFVIKSSK